MIRHTHIVKRCGMVILLFTMAVHPVVAQKINFGAYTTSQGISLVKSGDLNFNDKEPLIAAGVNTTVTIALSDAETQYVAIVADATRDITITVTSSQFLMTGSGGTGYQIPFTCNFAYSNLGIADVSTAKSSAVQIPAGFTAITLPMQRRIGGAPLPPPTPAHGGYTPPSATAYLFIYGKLGPIGNVSAGHYNGIINVTVNYTTN